MKFLLDSNVLFHIANDTEQGRVMMRRATKAGKNRCHVSVISVFEARSAIKRRAVAPPNIAALARLLPLFRSMALPENSAPYAAAAVQSLRDAGFDSKKIDLLDCLIAGHALARGYVLVTDNERHFKSIAGLTFQNWRRPA